MCVHSSNDPKWKKTATGWTVVPWGFRNLLLWIQKRYEPQGGIICTENGCALKEKNRKDGENDDERVAFFKGYILEMHTAMERGAQCRGYFAWSFMDNFEWAEGYIPRFGLHWVDYKTLKRYPKKSCTWYSKLITTGRLEKHEEDVTCCTKLLRKM